MGKLLAWVVIILVGMMVARIVGRHAAQRKARDANAAKGGGTWTGADAGGARRPGGSAQGQGQGQARAQAQNQGRAQAQDSVGGNSGYRYGNNIGKMWARAAAGRPGFGNAPAQPLARTDGGKAEQMVRCAHCGIYLPRSEALLTGGKTWCGQEHARLGQSGQT